MLGNNAATSLLNDVRRLEDLDKEITALKADQKQVFDELKAAGLPVKGIRKLFSDGKKDEDKLTADRQELIDAGALLGVQVYAAPVVEEPGNDFPEAKRAMARQKMQSLERLDEELKENKKARTQVVKDAKGDGFSPSIIERVLVIRRSDVDELKETTELVDLYLASIAKVEKEPQE
jgi:uncharacterized protein (UPF0335 family)